MRVVSHSCSNTEIICALGCADWLVGVDDHSDYPPEVVKDLPRIGPDLAVDPKKIQQLKPDLVIASDTVPGHSAMLKQLRAAGLPLLITAPRQLSDIGKDIREIATALQITQRGEQLASQFEQQLQHHSITGWQSLPATQRRKVLVEWWPKPVIVPGKQSWVNELLLRAGALNPWQYRDVESLEINAEQARDIDPDAIIMSWCGVEEKNYRAKHVLQRDGWQEINAIRQQRVYPISEAYLGRPGPRLIEGLKQLTAIVQQIRPV